MWELRTPHSIGALSRSSSGSRFKWCTVSHTVAMVTAAGWQGKIRSRGRAVPGRDIIMNTSKGIKGPGKYYLYGDIWVCIQGIITQLSLDEHGGHNLQTRHNIISKFIFCPQHVDVLTKWSIFFRRYFSVNLYFDSKFFKVAPKIH